VPRPTNRPRYSTNPASGKPGAIQSGSSPRSPDVNDRFVRDTSDWHDLARLILDSLDWARICDRDARCETIRVDSVIRRTAVPGSPRSARIRVAGIGELDLPRDARRYILGDREYVDRGEDAMLTMVAYETVAASLNLPNFEVEIDLMRPRRDTILVMIRAERRDGAWLLLSINYVYS
jgi:hypothetical protein